MSTTPNDLERDVEAVRSRLKGTLDLLRGRLNASGMVEDLLGTARGNEAGARLYDASLEAVRRSPLPVLLTCFGAVLLLRQVAGGKPSGTRATRAPDIVAPRPPPPLDIEDTDP